MEKTNNISSNLNMLVIVFPLLALLVPVVAATVAHFTIGFTAFFQELSGISLVCLVSLLIIMAILPVLLKKLSPAGSIISGVFALLLSLTLLGWIFRVAFVKSKIFTFQLSDPKELTAEQASRIARMLDGNKKVCVMFTTEKVYQDAMKNKQINEKLRKELGSHDLYSKGKAFTYNVFEVLSKIGLKQNNSGKFEIPVGVPLKDVYDSIKNYQVCRELYKYALGCLVPVYLQEGSQLKDVSILGTIKGLATTDANKKASPPAKSANKENKQETQEKERVKDQAITDEAEQMNQPADQEDQLNEEKKQADNPEKTISSSKLSLIQEKERVKDQTITDEAEQPNQPADQEDQLNEGRKQADKQENDDILLNNEGIIICRLDDKVKLTTKHKEEILKTLNDVKKTCVIFVANEHLRFIRSQFGDRNKGKSRFTMLSRKNGTFNFMTEQLAALRFEPHSFLFKAPSGGVSLQQISKRMNEPEVRAGLLEHFGGCIVILRLKDGTQIEANLDISPNNELNDETATTAPQLLDQKEPTHDATTAGTYNMPQKGSIFSRILAYRRYFNLYRGFLIVKCYILSRLFGYE